MSYEPTTWTTGDVITAAKLNKIESGIANAGLVIHINAYEHDAAILDTKWIDIYNAAAIAPVMAIAVTDGDPYNKIDIIPINSVSVDDDEFTVVINNDAFVCFAADDYPNTDW